MLALAMRTGPAWGRRLSSTSWGPLEYREWFTRCGGIAHARPTHSDARALDASCLAMVLTEDCCNNQISI